MESGLLLDVVVREGTSILELLASEDKSLLVRGNTLLVLNLGLHRLDGVGGLNLESDGLSSECLIVCGSLLTVWLDIRIPSHTVSNEPHTIRLMY